LNSGGEDEKATFAVESGHCQFPENIPKGKVRKNAFFPNLPNQKKNFPKPVRKIFELVGKKPKMKKFYLSA
jgi:hypothetical protein